MWDVNTGAAELTQASSGRLAKRQPYTLPVISPASHYSKGLTQPWMPLLLKATQAGTWLVLVTLWFLRLGRRGAIL